MATSSYPFFAQMSPRNQVIAHVMLKNAEAFSLITPPLVILASMIRRNPLKPFTIRRLFNSTTRWTVIGAAVGAVMGYGRMMSQTEASIEDRAVRLKYNASQVRNDDYAFIGSALSAVIAPALFMKRAPLYVLVAGGAAMGLGAGTLVHTVTDAAKGEDVRPTGMVGEIPVVGGNDK